MTKARDLANASTALSAVSATELGYLDGVTSAVQTQIDAKLATATASSTYQPLVSGVSNTEIGYLDGVTSAIQTQLNQKPEVVAGKNLIINGAFDFWQRGTSFTTSAIYCADRWYTTIDSPTAGTISQQTSSLPAGFRYSIRVQRNSGNTGTAALGISQPLDTATSIPAQGKTVVFSYWAKAGANYSNGSSVLNIRINSGTGTDQGPTAQFGGWTGYAETAPDQAITTTWTRYTATYNVPSNATQLGIRFFMSGTGTAGANDWFEITGVQLEVGSVATPFSRAGGTIQGELAACKRYYERRTAVSTQGYAPYAAGYFNFATAAVYAYSFETEKRVQPTITLGPSINQFMAGYNGNQGQAAVTLTAGNISKFGCYLTLVPSGTPFTSGQATTLQDGGSAVSYIEVSAEL